MFSRPRLLAAVAALAPLVPAAAAVLGVAAPASAQSPNILVLLADDLGIDQVAAYGVGVDLPNTPSLDLLASNGVVFRNAYANPTCSPSRSALQTGRHAFRTGIGKGVDEKSPALSLDEITIPEMLDAGDSGYSHAAFGKWHLGNKTVGGPLAPNLAGYGHYQGVPGNLGPGLDKYFLWKKITNGVASFETGYLTTQTVDDAIDWISQQSQPWFAYVAFHAPHQPFHAPPSHLHSVDLSNLGTPTENPRPYYKAMVEAMDTEIGRLLGSLGGELANTWVIFLGDNGTPNAATVAPFDPLHAKGSVYDGGVHVPLIAFRPGMNKPGTESDALVSICDIYATVASLAGVSPNPPIPFGPKPKLGPGPRFVEPTFGAPTNGRVLDSVSMLPYLNNSSTPSIRRFVMGERFGADGDDFHRTIRDGKYKWQIDARANDLGEDIFLFDIEEDPFELNDLLTNPGGLPAYRIEGYLTSALQELLDS